MTAIQLVNSARKFCVAMAAALVVAGAGLADGTLTGAEWVAILAAFGGAIGVYQATNEVKKEL